MPLPLLRSVLRTALIAACALLSLSRPAAAAMTMPEAPPELSEELRSYRTDQQRRTAADAPQSGSEPVMRTPERQSSLLKSAASSMPVMRTPERYAPEGQRVQQVHADDAFEELLGRAPVDDRQPTVPGDQGSGVQRYRFTYVPRAGIMLPRGGTAVIRFYDLNGQPWHISAFDFDQQGCHAQLSADPSELIIRHGTGGASSTTLHVTLEDLGEVLELSVQITRQRNHRGHPVTTALHGIDLEHYLDLSDFVQFPLHDTAQTPGPADADDQVAAITPAAQRDALVECIGRL